LNERDRIHNAPLWQLGRSHKPEHKHCANHDQEQDGDTHERPLRPTRRLHGAIDRRADEEQQTCEVLIANASGEFLAYPQDAVAAAAGAPG
jgi:hypothetical protein